MTPQKPKTPRGKIIQMEVEDNNLWVLTDTGRIFIRQPEGDWKDLTKKF